MYTHSHVFTRPAGLSHLELRTATQANECYRTHTHEEYAFGAIDAGHAVYRYGPHAVALCPGMTVMMEPGLAHACNPDPAQAWSYRMLYVNADWVHRSFEPFASQTTLRGLALAQHHSHAPCIHKALCAVMDSVLQTPNPLEVDEQLLLFLERHTLVPRWLEAKSTSHITGLNAVRDLIHARVEHTLSLEQLAQVGGLDGFQLIRKFKQAFGQTPHAYQIDLRLNRAKLLLKRSSPLSDVAHQLGFSDQAHFQRQFKQRHATTPKNYLGASRPTHHG